MEDFKHITAAEARERIREKLINSPRIGRFMKEVEEAIGDETNNFRISIGDDDFSDVELKYLESLGYSLDWNSACLWYEVSWSIL